jgi:protease-4
MPEDYPTPPPPPPLPPSSYPYAQGAPYAQSPPYGYSQGYGRPPAPRRSAWFYIGIIAGSLAAVCLLVTLMVWFTMRSAGGNADGLGLNPDRIAVVDITGVILSAESVDNQLRKFGDDSSVKAILLHINSPGGGAAASQEIYHEVLRVRQENHKKVIASIESVVHRARTTSLVHATKSMRMTRRWWVQSA